MPQPFYMNIEGTTQGLITEAASTVIGHEDEVLCQAFNHEVHRTFDPQTGQTTGKRIHGPATIVKEFDKSSPGLYQAVVAGEMLTIKLNFWRITDAGTEENYFQISFEECRPVSIKPWVPNALNAENGNFRDMEDFTWTYKRITWEHLVESTIASDDWDVPII